MLSELLWLASELNPTPEISKKFFSFLTFHCSLHFHAWTVKRLSRIMLFSQCVDRVQHHPGNTRLLEVKFQPQPL